MPGTKVTIEAGPRASRRRATASRSADHDSPLAPARIVLVGGDRPNFVNTAATSSTASTCSTTPPAAMSATAGAAAMSLSEGNEPSDRPTPSPSPRLAGEKVVQSADEGDINPHSSAKSFIFMDLFPSSAPSGQPSPGGGEGRGATSERGLFPHRGGVIDPPPEIGVEERAGPRRRGGRGRCGPGANRDRGAAASRSPHRAGRAPRQVSTTSAGGEVVRRTAPRSGRR